MNDTIKVNDKSSGYTTPIFTINIYRTKSSFLINGPKISRFLTDVLPLMETWAEKNNLNITKQNEMIKETLQRMKADALLQHVQHHPRESTSDTYSNNPPNKFVSDKYNEPSSSKSNQRQLIISAEDKIYQIVSEGRIDHGEVREVLESPTGRLGDCRLDVGGERDEEMKVAYNDKDEERGDTLVYQDVSGKADSIVKEKVGALVNFDGIDNVLDEGEDSNLISFGDMAGNSSRAADIMFYSEAVDPDKENNVSFTIPQILKEETNSWEPRKSKRIATRYGEKMIEKAEDCCSVFNKEEKVSYSKKGNSNLHIEDTQSSQTFENVKCNSKADNLHPINCEKSEINHENTENVNLQHFCICHKPYDNSRAMLECDTCHKWYHCDCIGYTCKDCGSKVNKEEINHIQKLKDEIICLKRENEDLKQSIQKGKAKIKQLENSVKKEKEKAEAMNKEKLNNLKSKSLESVSLQYEKINKEYTKLKERATALEKEAQTLRDMVKQYEEETTRLKPEIRYTLR